jgi:hypothetical protein
VEQLFIGDMMRHMWCAGIDGIEVLRPAVDAHGYDLVIRADGVTRHIQLKSVGKTAKNARFKIHKRLAEQESGCVIAITVDSASLELGPYLFFGSDPRMPLPSLVHYPTAKHTKGDSTGFKAPRNNHCVVPKSNFRTLGCIGDVNTFGYFLDRPGMLPPIPNTADLGWPARCVRIEECVRFPWAGGMHPWLDALIETDTHLIGVESKRYEPIRSRKTADFSEAYWKADWGRGMMPFERMRDQLQNGDMRFARLDAVQLVKHAFGLRTEARRRGKVPALVYLYAEPETWGSGEHVSADALEVHSREARRFASEVAGAEVKFRLCTYKELLSALRAAGDQGLAQHADSIAQKFRP